MKNKSIIITAVVNRLAEVNVNRNKELCKQNLYAEQKPFDKGEMTLTLMFMPDAELDEIAKLAGI